jgi:CDP-paratose 2-epimerase
MKILITGGAGFIGSNVANSFLEKGHHVYTVDNYSREGSLKNLQWLTQRYSKTGRFVAIENNISHPESQRWVRDIDVIFHYAGQVGVQASIENPTKDLRENIIGTFNILEYARKFSNKPLVVFASTNKVYGDIEVDKPVYETMPLSFCTPYGCSKGAADQYMLDYYRVFNVPTVVLRMSCIYGNRQLGTEEQGWLCHFMRNKDNPVTIYGDGTQVRDALYIDDYVTLMHKLVENKVAGQVFNIGGGIQNTISVNEALEKIGNTNVTYTDWRPSDQKYYVSNIHKIKDYTGWEPTIGVDEGLERLKEWVKEL